MPANGRGNPFTGLPPQLGASRKTFLQRAGHTPAQHRLPKCQATVVCWHLMMQQRLVAAGVKTSDSQLNQQGILKNTTGKPEATRRQTGCTKFIR